MSSALLRLGQIIETHRQELGLSQEDIARQGGPSDVTWRGVVGGTGPNPSASTLKKIDAALKWTQGSAAAVLAGGNPTINSAPGLGDPRLDHDEERRPGLDAYSTMELLHEIEGRVLAIERDVQVRSGAGVYGQFLDVPAAGKPYPASEPPAAPLTSSQNQIVPSWTDVGTEEAFEAGRQDQVDVEENLYAAYRRGERGFDEVTERRFRERALREEPAAARTAPSEDIEEHTRSLGRGEESQDPDDHED